jgi:hypothetical protein
MNFDKRIYCITYPLIKIRNFCITLERLGYEYIGNVESVGWKVECRIRRVTSVKRELLSADLSKTERSRFEMEAPRFKCGQGQGQSSSHLMSVALLTFPL